MCTKLLAFSSSIMSYLIRIAQKALGITLVFMSFIMIAAIFSYNPYDPSFNTSSNQVVTNWLSYFGSYASDLLVQPFGTIGAYFFLLITLKKGNELATLTPQKLAYYCFDILAIINCCVFAFSISKSLMLSGVLGSISYSSCAPHINHYLGSAAYTPYIFGCFFFLFFYLCFKRQVHASLKFIWYNIIVYFVSKLKKDQGVEYDDDIVSDSALNKETDTNKRTRNVSKKSQFELPSTALLKKAKMIKDNISEERLAEQSKSLISVLNDFGINGEIVSVNPGPVVTLYELKPAAGIKSARVIGLASDIARYMSAVSARVAVIPGKNALGIELPNKIRQTVYLRPLLESKNYASATTALSIILGRNIGGEPIIADLAKMPHLLIAGTTGSGKSVGVNAMILSLLYKLTPDQCKFIMVDPKMLELSVYNDIPHLLTPVVTDPKKAVSALKWTVKEMENRYISMSKIGVRNIEGYNEKIKSMRSSGEILSRKVQTGFDTETGLPIYEEQLLDLEPIPYIVVVVDEMADLMLVAGKDIEIAVQRLAQMARAAGIHLIMATQRPSVDVITGTIKANFPTRISFQVSSKIDSRTILEEQGAEQLLGQGDMLYLASGRKILRVHGPFVSDAEVESVVNALKKQGKPKYVDEILCDGEDGAINTDAENSTDDALYNEAVKIIKSENKVSTSFLQRRLQIGYNRAARIVDIMEKNGVVSPANHVGKREILK